VLKDDKNSVADGVLPKENPRLSAFFEKITIIFFIKSSNFRKRSSDVIRGSLTDCRMLQAGNKQKYTNSNKQPFMITQGKEL